MADTIPNLEQQRGRYNKGRNKGLVNTGRVLKKPILRAKIRPNPYMSTPERPPPLTILTRPQQQQNPA
jgi:hypothetical protein